jgi:MFS family permease
MIFATILAVFYICLIYSIIDATIAVIITVLSKYLHYPPWNFISAQVELMSLLPFIAIALGQIISGPLSDWSILFLRKGDKGIYEPKVRL